MNMNFARRSILTNHFLLLFLLQSLWLPSSTPAYTGDIDLNQAVTHDDVTSLVQYLAGEIELGAEAQQNADVNADGVGDVADVVSLIEALNITTRLNSSSPSGGEGDVAVTRETILRFDAPVEPATVGSDSIQARFGGASLPVRYQVSPARRTVTLFYEAPLPASARITIAINGDLLLDERGIGIDGNGDGIPGGSGLFAYDTLSLTTLPGTAVCGRVFASQLDPNASGLAGVNEPLEGVRVTVDGAEDELFTTTDAQGNFRLEPAPAGKFFVHIDGRTATNGVPAGAYYPFVGKAWTAIAGEEINVGEIYLPLVGEGTLQPVSASEPTTVSFPQAVLDEFPEFNEVSVVVPPDSLYADDGTRGGSVGIAPVPPDRLPGQLPEGLELPIVITVQTDGPSNFDVPVSACFPNVDNLPPGAKSALWSFNHDTGRFEVVGPMTVSEDGTLVCTDPGIGITAPGWHGERPGSEASDGGGDNDNPCAVQGQLMIAGSASCLTGSLLSLAGVTAPIGCAIGFAGGAAGAAADAQADPNLDAQAAQRNAALGSAVGCIPVAGGVIGGILCVDDTISRIQAYNNCVSGLNRPAGAAGSPLDAHPAPYSIEKGVVNIPGGVFAEQRALWAASADVYEIIFGSPVWFEVSPAESVLLRSFLEQINASVQDTSDGGGMISPFERDVLLDMPLPSNIAPADATALIDRFNKMEDNLLTPQEWDLAALEQSARDLEAIGQELQNRGWETTIDAVTRGLDQLGLLQDQALTGPGVAPRPHYYRLTNMVSDFSRFGRLSDQGRFVALFVAPDTPYLVEYFDPATFETASTTFFSASNGELASLPRALFGAPDPTDTDGDGLPDAAELIVGTGVNLPDSDDDGVTDAAELAQGTDPLDNRSTRVGILGTYNTTGSALDVVATDEMAIVADGNAGVSVFNIFNRMDPLIIAQVDTPGNALAAAFDGELIAVADDQSGLAVIELEGPQGARLIQSVDLGARAKSVEAVSGVAYAGLSDGRIVAIDMQSGTVLTELSTGTGSVEDLKLRGENLFAYTGQWLYSIRPIDRGAFKVIDSVSLDGSFFGHWNRSRLFVGNDVAYGTMRDGYTTFDVTNPTSLSVINQGTTGQNGWSHIVANGSGQAVATVGPNSFFNDDHHAVLYDVSDPTQILPPLDQVETPGAAIAAAIGNGLAYVADYNAGLHVINYLPFDLQGNPPTIDIETSFMQGEALEGQRQTVIARVGDDVQVRNVEFYLDGVRVFTDSSFPFQFSFNAPLRANQTSFTFRARASDTGGNTTWTAEQTVNLNPDNAPPQIFNTFPPQGAVSKSVQTIAVIFSEPLNPNSVNLGDVVLTWAGPDDTLGTADDQLVAAESIEYREGVNAIFVNYPTALNPGLHRARVPAGSVTDLTGNSLTLEKVWAFRSEAIATLRGQVVFEDLSPTFSAKVYGLEGLSIEPVFTAGNGTFILRDVEVSGNVTLKAFIEDDSNPDDRVFHRGTMSGITPIAGATVDIGQLIVRPDCDPQFITDVFANTAAEWDNEVFDMAWYDSGDGNGPQLYVAGDLTEVPGEQTTGIARWDGSQWFDVGGGITSNFGEIQAMTVYDDGSGPALYAGGNFTGIGGTDVSYLARWDGTNWTEIGSDSGIDGSVSDLLVHDFGAGEILLIGGGFSLFDDVTFEFTPGIATWDGSVIEGFGPGLFGGSLKFQIYDDGTGPSLFVGGTIQQTPDGRPVYSIVKWNGSDWDVIPGGFSFFGIGPPITINAMTVFDPGTGPELFIGGTFDNFESVPAGNLASWNGSRWQLVDPGTDLRVTALTTFDDGTGPALYVGGDFRFVGDGLPSRGFGRWDGTRWLDTDAGMGIGMSLSGGLHVFTFLEMPDTPTPRLLLGGNFGDGGDVLSRNLAIWGTPDECP